MRRVLRDNGLTLFFIALCLLAIVGEMVAGWKDYNQEQLAHHSETISFLRFLYSSDFAEAISENFQSEFLQFAAFILAAVWLVQRGSAESKSAADLGRMSDEQERVGAHAERGTPAWARAAGVRRWVFEHSLVLLMTFLFFFSWATQSVAGWSQYNEEQRNHKESTVSWVGYVESSDFWEKTMQNWQSEFMAVASMAIFSVYLRERGSPESKPVGAPHPETGGQS